MRHVGVGVDRGSLVLVDEVSSNPARQGGGTAVVQHVDGGVRADVEAQEVEVVLV